MIATRLSILSLLCFSLSHVKGSRLSPSKILEAQQQDASGREGKRGGKKFVSTSGTCKAWCQKQATTFPLDLDLLKQQTDAKCQTPRGMRDCKDCAGGGLTIPDCREKHVSPEEQEALPMGFEMPDAPKEQPTADYDVPFCVAGATNGLCRFKEGEICSHVSAAWCPPPSRNAGDKFRHEGKPMCCFNEEESDMNDVEKEVDDAQKAIASVEDGNEEPAKPVPVCAAGHTFNVDSFQRKGKTVHVCRNAETGQFAKKVCCDAATFKMLEDKEKADDVCGTVANKFCKTDLGVFDGKRSKYPDMPSTFSCKRMYSCIEKGQETFGPVHNPSWCLKAKTGLSKNRSARKVCIAVKM